MNEPKRLYRVEQGKILAGVCGGVAEYFNIDPSIVRIIWAALFFAGGIGFWLYLVCAFVVPKKSDAYPRY